MRPFLLNRASTLLLPRAAAREGVSWPKCGRCLKTVDAYGIDRDTPRRLDVWVRCDGVRDGMRIHRPERAGISIDKRRYVLGISQNELTDIMSRLVLQPGANGKWVLDRRAGGETVREA